MRATDPRWRIVPAAGQCRDLFTSNYDMCKLCYYYFLYTLNIHLKDTVTYLKVPSMRMKSDRLFFGTISVPFFFFSVST